MVSKFKFCDVPGEDYDETKCPYCKHKLRKKWQGMACVTSGCPLQLKLNKGWVRLTRDSGWSKSRTIINGLFGSNRRNFLQKEFAELRKQVIIRDDYKCRMCDYSLADDFNFKVGLCVHHIVPASEEMAMYLDIDNLITLCKDCHYKLHSNNKNCFGGGNKNGS